MSRDGQQASATSAAQRRYALGLLMAVGLLNFVDRQCMSILIVPIRRDLALTDTQIGILTGLAYSLVYTGLSVPIARLADRGSRRLVITGCLVVWSLMTAGSGLAVGFLMLALLRMGVAIGEAGCVPTTTALLSDFYPGAERARAIATWQLVFPLGTLVGVAAGGWLSVVVGWRHTFMLLGLCGVAVAPVVLRTLREPARGAGTPGASAFMSGLRVLWSSRAYRHMLIGGAFIAYPLNATLVWNAPFYNRVHGYSVAELALYLALLAGGAGAVGLYAGGQVAARLARRDPRWLMWVPGIAGVAVVPCMLAQYFAGSGRLSLLLGIVPVILLNAFMPPQAAGAQILAPPQLRAQASALIVLISGTMGTAVGPFMTGVISDFLDRGWQLGPDSLRWAIGGSSLLALIGGLCFLAGARHYAAESAARS
jgi:predicted MFS family arabinose efflux permease